MTLATTANKVTYVGNGATTVFSYTFPILDADDLVVVTTVDGVDTELAGNLYSVTGIGNPNGGTVTYPLSGSPIASTVRLTILRRLALVQETNLTNQTTLYPVALENALDRIVMLVQQNAEKLSRALLFSIADDFDEIVLPGAEVRANKYLTFDFEGNPSVTSTVTIGTLNISSFWETTLVLMTAALAREGLGVGVTGTLGQAGADTLLGNPSGSLADPSYNSLISYFARVGNTRGMMFRRGASTWETVALGASGTVLTSNGTDVVYDTPPVGEGQFSNLAVTSTADTTVTVSAHWVTLANASNIVKLVRTVSATIATGTSGVNGLDTGSMAANTWYAVWIIYNPTTQTTAAMLSLSSSAPTMPSGYTFKHRFGWVKTRSGTTALVRTRQYNSKTQYVVNATDALPELSSGTSVTLLGVSVPSTAVEIGVQTMLTVVADRATFSPNSTYGVIDALIKSVSNNFGSSTNAAYNSDFSNVTAWAIIEGAAEVNFTGAARVKVFGWVDSI